MRSNGSSATLIAERATVVAAEIDSAFNQLLTIPDDPRRVFYMAMRHAAIGGGKRLRPLLVAATCELFDVAPTAALRTGLAVECIHVYSLVHDDLPSMDNDDMRRGKPTVHRAFDEATAILVGDALHDLGYEILADESTHPDPFVRVALLKALAQASGPAGMVGGQVIDIEAEKARFDLATVTQLQQMKTGALFRFCVEAGAILGNAAADQRDRLKAYAQDVGLAFQIADDLLDVEGVAAVAGKALQKDGDAGKETFVSLLGIEKAREEARSLIENAKAQLHGFGDKADLLRAIADYIVERDR